MNVEHKNLAKVGSALSYSYYEIYNNFENFKNDDIIILCLTQLDRRWFLKDWPAMGCLPWAVEWVKGQKVEHARSISNAIKQYLLYLDDNFDLEVLYLYMFLDVLNTVTKEKNLKTIVIHGFPDTDNNVNKGYNNLCLVENNLVEYISNLECEKIGRAHV